MTGQKHRSGGPRTGAGRLRQRLFLDGESARELAILVGQRRLVQPDATGKSLVQAMIHDAWLDLDQQYQADARSAHGT